MATEEVKNDIMTKYDEDETIFEYLDKAEQSLDESLISWAFNHEREVIKAECKIFFRDEEEEKQKMKKHKKKKDNFTGFIYDSFVYCMTVFYCEEYGTKIIDDYYLDDGSYFGDKKLILFLEETPKLSESFDFNNPHHRHAWISDEEMGDPLKFIPLKRFDRYLELCRELGDLPKRELKRMCKDRKKKYYNRLQEKELIHLIAHHDCNN